MKDNHRKFKSLCLGLGMDQWEIAAKMEVSLYQLRSFMYTKNCPGWALEALEKIVKEHKQTNKQDYCHICGRAFVPEYEFNIVCKSCRDSAEWKEAESDFNIAI